jgi:hypothetical protein
MGLNIKLHNITADNSFTLSYKTGTTIGSLTNGFTSYGGTYPSSTTVIDVAISNYFNTQIWFKFTDTINGNFSIENVYVNQEEYYSDCLHCCEFDNTVTSNYVSGF